jgi:hypothetical protein
MVPAVMVVMIMTMSVTIVIIIPRTFIGSIIITGISAARG